MKLIKPTLVSDAMLISSDVVESGYTLWNSGTTYSTIGTMAALAAGTAITVYESLKYGNLLLRSEEFDNASWSKLTATVTSNAATDPNGTATADKIVEDNSNGSHGVNQSYTYSAGVYTYSVFLKAAGRSWVRLSNGFGLGGYFDIANGVIGTLFSPTTATMTAYPNGWWRVTYTFTATPGSNTNYILLATGDNAYAYAGDNTSGVLAWGAQLVPGAAPGDYTPTTSAAALNLNRSPDVSPTWWKARSTAYAAYAGGTTYAINNIVTDTTGHRLFKSVQNANIGHALTDPLWWTDIGPTNRWAPFDAKVGTAASRIGSMSYQLQPGGINSLAVLDSDAEAATLTMTSGGVPVYSSTRSFNVSGEAIDSWYRWFFDPIGTRSNVVFDDIPIYADGILTLTLTGRDSSSAVEVGSIIVGNMRSLGTTEAGAKISILDFSKKEKDAFGSWVIVERGYSKQMVLRTLIQTSQADNIQALLAELRATAIVYIGEDGYDSLIIYGFFTDFSIDLAQGKPGYSYLSLTIEGLSTST